MIASLFKQVHLNINSRNLLHRQDDEYSSPPKRPPLQKKRSKLSIKLLLANIMAQFMAKTITDMVDYNAKKMKPFSKTSWLTQISFSCSLSLRSFIWWLGRCTAELHHLSQDDRSGKDADMSKPKHFHVSYSKHPTLKQKINQAKYPLTAFWAWKRKNIVTLSD